MAAQREWFEKDYYKELGVVSTATDKEITRAYRKLAKQYHPDANPGSEERFKEISAAYDVLGDAEKRKEYDEVRKHGPVPGGFGGGFGAPGGGTFRMEDMGNLGDLFGGLFGNRGRTARGPQRGADMEAALHLSFSDAVHGVTTSVNVPEDVRCSNCKGTGAAPGTATHTCPRCGGTGHAQRRPGPVLAQHGLPRLRGPGHPLRHALPGLQGLGHRAQGALGQGAHPRRGRGRPAHPGQGSRARPGQGMAPPGDLYVVVHVGTHPTFGRNGRNLTLTVPITFPEAALGTTVTVPTLDAKVTLKVPARNGLGHRDARAWPRRPRRNGPQRRQAGRPHGQAGGPVCPPSSPTSSGRRWSRWRRSPTRRRGRRSKGEEEDRHGRQRCQPGGLRDLRGRRADRRPPADAAHLRAQGPAGPLADQRRHAAVSPTPTWRACGTFSS